MVANQKNVNNTESNKISRDNIVIELISKLNDFRILLSQFKDFEEEYYDYCDIQEMANYILKNNKLINKDNLSFINEIFNSFCDILKCKYSEGYLEKYNNFSSKLIDWQQYFFTEIYTPSECYDEEALSKITNLLLD